jgi:hypothetical protein
MSWWREKFPAPAGTRTPDHPVHSPALYHWAFPTLVCCMDLVYIYIYIYMCVCVCVCVCVCTLCQTFFMCYLHNVRNVLCFCHVVCVLLLLHLSAYFVSLWLIPHSIVAITNLWIHGMYVCMYVCICVCAWIWVTWFNQSTSVRCFALPKSFIRSEIIKAVRKWNVWNNDVCCPVIRN